MLGADLNGITVGRVTIGIVTSSVQVDVRCWSGDFPRVVPLDDEVDEAGYDEENFTRCRGLTSADNDVQLLIGYLKDEAPHRHARRNGASRDNAVLAQALKRAEPKFADVASVYQTSNLGVRGSNPFERASDFNELVNNPV